MDINLSEVCKKLQQSPKMIQTIQLRFVLQFQREMSEIQIPEMLEMSGVLNPKIKN